MTLRIPRPGDVIGVNGSKIYRVAKMNAKTIDLDLWEASEGRWVTQEARYGRMFHADFNRIMHWNYEYMGNE